MFKEQFRYLRLREGYTQREIAEKLHISKSTIGMYETGQREPNFETLEAIADFFNVDIAFLIGEKKNTPTESVEVLSKPKRELIELVRNLDDHQVAAILALLRK